VIQHVYKKFEDGSRFLFLHSSNRVTDPSVMDIFLCDVAGLPKDWNEEGSRGKDEEFLEALRGAFSDGPAFGSGVIEIERDNFRAQELDDTDWGHAVILPSHAARADAAVEALP
jgi:hypothetical protein